MGRISLAIDTQVHVIGADDVQMQSLFVFGCREVSDVERNISVSYSLSLTQIAYNTMLFARGWNFMQISIYKFGFGIGNANAFRRVHSLSISFAQRMQN